MKNMYPFKFEPIYVETVWGDTKFAKIRGRNEIIGSSWEISAHPHADNCIANGKYKGQTLSTLLDLYPKQILGKKKRNQMLRISFLDARDSLSIQVHPNDDYAHKYENDEGKVEAWYILKADPKSNLIAGTTTDDIQVIKQAIKDEKIEDYVDRIEINEGDFICIESGQLHAFGSGLLGLEISQNSDVTYRFYDFHRKDASGNERELHLDKCFDVVDFSKKGQKFAYPFKMQQETTVYQRKEFTIKLIDINDKYTLYPNGDTFYCLTNVLNDCHIIYEDQIIDFGFTENILIPADCSKITFEGKTRIIISYVD